MNLLVLNINILNIHIVIHPDEGTLHTILGNSNELGFCTHQHIYQTLRSWGACREFIFSFSWLICNAYKSHFELCHLWHSSLFSLLPTQLPWSSQTYCKENTPDRPNPFALEFFNINILSWIHSISCPAKLLKYM